MYKNLFYRANRIWTSGPAFARSARSFQILTNACAFYCEKKSTVLKTVDSEKLFIGQTGFGAPPRLRSTAAPVQILTNAFAFCCRKKQVSEMETCSDLISIGQTGFEPATSTSRTSRATSCAIARKKCCSKLSGRKLQPRRPEHVNRRTVKKNCEDLEQFFRFYLQATCY